MAQPSAAAEPLNSRLLKKVADKQAVMLYVGGDEVYSLFYNFVKNYFLI
jgi:GTP cyclohydrolase III